MINYLILIKNVNIVKGEMGFGDIYMLEI